MTIDRGPISIQLWTTRGEDPLADQLAALAGMGYTDVQPFHDQYDDVGGMKALLQEHDLTATSGHFNIAMFDGDARLVFDAARALDMKLVVAPWLEPEDRPTDADGWKAVHHRLVRMKAMTEDAGFAFAWHNHDFEFQLLPCGSYGIQYLLGDEIDLAADLSWIHVSGQDPAHWLKHYAGRVPAIHVKDVAPKGENLDQMGFAELGEGVVDWPTLWSICDEQGIALRIAEHDMPLDWRIYAGNAANVLRTWQKI
jgi:sugar phosphate isomerase/epimerase